MIAKISTKRSNDPGGLISYLFGPGHANEHANARTIAGTVHYPGAGGRSQTQVAADLRLPQRLWPKVAFPGGHVWHCSLALAAAEGDLPDAKWNAIAHDFVNEMGFADPRRGPLRWSAVHHGVSAEGNAHIHLVVNLVREDGSKVNIWQDMVRSQAVLRKLEARYGLSVLQSRHSPLGAGAVPYTAAEVARARQAGTEIERIKLEGLVRGYMAASLNEGEFVRRIRGAGLEIRPRFADGRVTGFSVSLDPPSGKQRLWFSGGKLARDLTLPRMRVAWGQSKADETAALAEWRQGKPGAPVAPSAREVKPGPATPDALARSLHDLQRLGRGLRTATPAQFAAMSGDVAGVLATASLVAPEEQRAALRAAAREVGAWAGTRSPVPHVKRGSGAAARAFIQAMNPRSEWARAYMLRQLMEAVMELHRLHRASRSMVGSVPEGGVRMSDVHDDVEGVLADVGMIAATTTATMVAAHARNARPDEAARKHAAQVALAVRAGGRRPGFFGRFSRSGPDGLQPRDSVPPGFRETHTPDDWAALHRLERRQLDPDDIGRHPLDIDLRPETGPTLSATATQIQLAGRLGEAQGISAKGVEVSLLSRLAAAQEIGNLEDKLPSEVVDKIYLDLELARRKSTSDGVEYVMPETLQDRYAAATPPTEAMPAVVTGVVEPPQIVDLNDPSTWRTAGDPVRPKQRESLLRYGYPADEIDLLNKGQASTVIRAHRESPEAGNAAMDKALAAAEASGTVASAQPSVTPTPAPGPERPRTR